MDETRRSSLAYRVKEMGRCSDNCTVECQHTGEDCEWTLRQLGHACLQMLGHEIERQRRRLESDKAKKTNHYCSSHEHDDVVASNHSRTASKIERMGISHRRSSIKDFDMWRSRKRSNGLYISNHFSSLYLISKVSSA